MNTASNRSNITSALLAGFISGLIWIAITVLVGGFTTAAILGGGFAFLVGTAVVTYFVYTAVTRRRRRS